MLGELSDVDQRIFALSFHVDYWNRLGWVDPFSQKAFSQRQRRYAQVLKDRRVYTPEMVVNGKDGFVGSDRQRAKHRIAQALRDTVDVSLDLTTQSGGNATRLQVVYRLDVVPENAVLHVALVEKMAQVQVPRGENAGRSLQHHHVVREFVSVKADTMGVVRLKIPDGLEREKIDVIGFVQDKVSMSILAANFLGQE